MPRFAPSVQPPSNSPVLQSNTPPKYTIVDLGVNVIPAAINNSNLIVGSIVTPSYSSTGFSYKNGTLQQLPPLPGDPQSAASDVNDVGTIVGWSGTPLGTFPTNLRAVSYSGTTPRDLGNINGNQINGATANNNAGEIVGWSEPYNGGVASPWCSSGVVYSPGPPTQASGWNGDPLAINDAGMIVGATCADPPDKETWLEYPTGGATAAPTVLRLLRNRSGE